MDKLKVIILDGFAQVKAIWQSLLLIYVPILSLLTTIVLISHATDHLAVSYFTHDVTILGHIPFYAGLVSQLGLMLWAGTVALCAFAFLLIGGQNRSHPTKRFLIHAAIFSAVLLLDDTFLLHEDVIPDHLGITEKFIFLLYFFLYLVFFVSNLNAILGSEYFILALAMTLFGISTFLDVIHVERFETLSSFFSERSQAFIEDSFKFAGIATWLLYFTRYSIQSLCRYGLRPLAGVYRNMDT